MPKRSSSRGSWGSCRASEEVFVSDIWGSELQGSTRLEEKSLCRGRESRDSTRVALSAECHTTMELCGALQGVTSAGMNAASSQLLEAPQLLLLLPGQRAQAEGREKRGSGLLHMHGTSGCFGSTSR